MEDVTRSREDKTIWSERPRYTTHFDWEVEQKDVKTAVLYPEIEEEVYIKMPEGHKLFYPKDQNAEGIARLIKTLYGLR